MRFKRATIDSNSKKKKHENLPFGVNGRPLSGALRLAQRVPLGADNAGVAGHALERHLDLLRAMKRLGLNEGPSGDEKQQKLHPGAR